MLERELRLKCLELAISNTPTICESMAVQRAKAFYAFVTATNPDAATTRFSERWTRQTAGILNGAAKRGRPFNRLFHAMMRKIVAHINDYPNRPLDPGEWAASLKADRGGVENFRHRPCADDAGVNQFVHQGGQDRPAPLA
jgi:hypothetical protein